MQSYLIIGRYKKQTQKLIKELNLKRLDFEASKVEKIREIQRLSFLSVKQKTAYVLDFNDVTIEAQNAFLKSLEEPQKNIIFVLVSVRKDHILDTILSRCQIIEVPSKEEIKSEDMKEIEDFLKLDLGEKFLYSSKLKERSESVEFLKKFLKVTHDLFLKEKKQKYLKILKAADNALFALERQNGNVKLQLTNFLVVFS